MQFTISKENELVIDGLVLKGTNALHSPHERGAPIAVVIAIDEDSIHQLLSLPLNDVLDAINLVSVYGEIALYIK